MPTPYHNLLDIPEATSGDWKVKHLIQPAGRPLVRTSTRTMLFGGHRAAALCYSEPTRWHQLYEGTSLWMTDLPIEQFQARRVLPRLHGHVLVGGLGLGMVLQLLRRRRSVREITVIEYSKDVIRLVAPHHDFADTRVTFVQADIAAYLHDCEPVFDTAFFDTWSDDGEGTFFDTVLPLRELARRAVRGSVLAWNEDVMRAQLLLGLHSKLHFHRIGSEGGIVIAADYSPLGERSFTEYTGSVYHDWAVPFFTWVDKNHASLTIADRQRAAALYVTALDTRKGPTRRLWQRRKP